jgi:nucleoside-diphosphate-sugar epimerase
MRIFLAGGTGVLGRALIPALLAADHHVVATTRTPDKQTLIRDLGAEPVVLDALDAAAVRAAVSRAAPDVIVHQLTALSTARNLRRFDRTFAVTNQLRTVGTDNLLAAAQAAGVRRFVAQSFTGWPNERRGDGLKTETDPLDDNPPRQQRATLAAIRYVERAVTAAPLEGVVLRYGLFYGAGASAELMEAIRRRRLPVIGDGRGVWSWIHVDDAASATVAALTRGSGIYNIVDDDPAPVGEMFPALAAVIGAPPPRHIPVWLARLVAGEVPVSMLTAARGSSNAKARRELEWAPRWSSWREGFRASADAQPVRAGG